MEFILEKDGKKIYKKKNSSYLVKKYPRHQKKKYIEEEFLKSKKASKTLDGSPDASFPVPFGFDVKKRMILFEYIDGVNLCDLFYDIRVSDQRIRKLFYKIGKGLGILHRELGKDGIQTISTKTFCYGDIAINNILVKNNTIYFIDFEVHSDYELQSVDSAKKDLVSFIMSFRRVPLFKKHLGFFRDYNLLENSFLKGYEAETGIFIDLKEYLIEKMLFYEKSIKESHLLRKISDKRDKQKIKKLFEQYDYNFRYQKKKDALPYDMKNDDTHNNFYRVIWDAFEKDILLHEISRLKKRDTYVDFATGSGRVLVETEKYFKSTHRIDIADEMLKIAKERTKKSLLVVGDLTKKIPENIPQKNDCISTYRFFLNANAILRYEIMFRLADLLNKKGVLIFNVHGMKYSFPYFIHKIRRLFKRCDQRYMSHREIKELLSYAGLTIKHYKGYGILPSIFTKIIGTSGYAFIDAILQKTLLGRFAMFRTYVAELK